MICLLQEIEKAKAAEQEALEAEKAKLFDKIKTMRNTQTNLMSTLKQLKSSATNLSKMHKDYVALTRREMQEFASSIKSNYGSTLVIKLKVLAEILLALKSGAL